MGSGSLHAVLVSSLILLQFVPDQEALLLTLRLLAATLPSGIPVGTFGLS